MGFLPESLPTSYDSTTADPITGTASLNGVITSDVVNLGSGSAAFNDPNAGTGKTVTFGGYGISGTDAANYSLSQPANGSADITARGLIVTASDQNPTYGFGGTGAALGTTAFTSSGLQGGQTIGGVTLATDATLSSSSNYSAGTWTITPSNAAGGTFNPANYSISYAGGTLTVAQKALTITGVSGTSKVYDSTTGDPITGTASLNGVITNDTVNLAGGSAAFGDPNVGVGKTVTFSGYGISGTDAANYSLSQPANGSADITARGLTVTASDQNPTYGFGGTSASLGTTAFTSSGLQGGQTIGGVTLATNATLSSSSNYSAGTWTITPGNATGGTFNPANYSISYAGGTLTVAQKALTITGVSGTNKVYDSTTSDSITGTASLNGVITNDTVNLAGSSAAFGDPNVGTNKTVTFGGYGISGTDAANYSLSQPANSSADITAVTQLPYVPPPVPNPTAPPPSNPSPTDPAPSAPTPPPVSNTPPANNPAPSNPANPPAVHPSANPPASGQPGLTLPSMTPKLPMFIANALINYPAADAVKADPVEKAAAGGKDILFTLPKDCVGSECEELRSPQAIEKNLSFLDRQLEKMRAPVKAKEQKSLIVSGVVSVSAASIGYALLFGRTMFNSLTILMGLGLGGRRLDPASLLEYWEREGRKRSLADAREKKVEGLFE